MLTTRLLKPSIITAPKFHLLSRNFSLKPRLPKLPKLSSFKLKEDVPGNIIGTVNDAYVPPEADITHGSFEWAYERMVILGMTPLVVFPFIAGVDYPIADATLAILIALHARYGLKSCIIDYIPIRKFGIWHKIAMFMLNFGTWVSVYGIYIIETEQNGICNLIKSFWHI